MNSLFTDIRAARYQPGIVMDTHVHDDTSLSLVLSGCYEESIRGRCAGFEAGSLLVCPPDEPHGQRFGREGVFKLVLIPSANAVERLDDRAHLAEAPALRSVALADVGRRMLAELHRDDAFSSTVLEGLSFELIGLFARERADRQAPPPRYLSKAIDYLRMAESLQLTLADVSHAIDCDAGRLSDAFRQHLGCTLGDYQRRLRVERAASLLTSSRVTIGQIALMCGFADQPHLNRTFKAQLGVTPAAFRRNAR